MNRGQPSVFCFPDIKELLEGRVSENSFFRGETHRGDLVSTGSGMWDVQLKKRCSDYD